MLVKFEVIGRDIELGKKEHDKTLPIHRAIKRVMPKDTYISVGYAKVYLGVDIGFIDLPPYVLEWVEHFDRFGGLPFSFQLNIPKEFAPKPKLKRKRKKFTDEEKQRHAKIRVEVAKEFPQT